MDKSLRNKITISAVIVILAAMICASGCVGVFNPTPKEVRIHDNIISVDSNYISDSLIWTLCLSPDTYCNEMFDAVEKYLPSENSVIEVGAGIGAVTAFVNDRLIISSNHIAVEPNIYLIPCLEKTKEINGLGCVFVQKAVAYGSDTVQISVNSNIINNEIVKNSNNIIETIKVNTTTLQQLAESSMISDKNNLTVIIDVGGYEHTIVQRENAFIRDNVKTMIVSVQTDNKNTPETFGYIMNNLGFKTESNVYDESANCNVMVFVKE
ncbi:MAG: FkbM family methyltransferase [Methanocorpusculum sp.]|nr:FkbM family methyltransferase [Methanocorpusculum sp.]